MTRLVYSIFIFITSYIIYLLTFYRSVPGGDSGMVIGAAASFGVPHPPGYPLFTILAHYFIKIPFPFLTLAGKVNHFNVILSSLSHLVFFNFLTSFTNKVKLSFFLTLIFALTPNIWEHSLAAEYFTLNNLLTSLLLLTTFKYIQTKNILYSYLSAFIFGLGLSNHQTIIFLGIPIIFYAIFDLRFKVLKLLPFFLLGLVPYIYLPIASSKINFVTWGDSTTFQGFLKQILRQEFGTFKLGTGDYFAGSTFFSKISYYLKNLNYNISPIGIILFLYGVFISLKKNKNVFNYIILASYFFYTLTFHFLTNFNLSEELFLRVTERFWIFPLFHIFIIIAICLKEIKGAWYGLIIFPIILVTYHFNDLNKKNDFLLEHWGKSFLDNMPLNSILLSRGDLNLNVLKYLQLSNNYRLDVKILDLELLKTDWYHQWVKKYYPEIKLPNISLKRFDPKIPEPNSYLLADLIYANVQDYPMFKVTEKSFEQNIGSFKLRPYGKLWQILPPNYQPKFKDFHLYLNNHLQKLEPFIDICRVQLPKNIWDKMAFTTYQRSIEFTQFYFFEIIKNNINTKESQEIIKEMIKISERMFKECSFKEPYTYKNLGLFYYYHLDKSAEEKSRLKFLWDYYIQNDRTKDPTMSWIKSEVLKL